LIKQSHYIMINMRICVVTHTFPRFKGDPVAPFMEDFCKGLAELKHDVYLLTPFDPKFKLKEKRSYKVKLYRYIYPDSFHLMGYSRTLVGDQKLSHFVYLLAPFMFIAQFFALLKLVRREKIDIISAHWIVPNGFIAALVSKITGVPLVITVPGSDMYMAKKNKISWLMASFAANQAKVVASNSVRYLDEFPKIGIKLLKIKEIPYGVDTSKYKNIKLLRRVMRQKYNLKTNDTVLLAVGRMVEKKGTQYIIKAMPDITKKNKNVKLVLIGDGSEKEELMRLAKKLKVENNTVFLGKVDYGELSKIYAISDVYVAPSVKDSFGNLESHIVAMFEAIASGIPVVATELAVSANYVVDGKNGYRVPQKKPKALSDAINKVLKTGNLSKMGKFSQQIAQKHLSYKSSAKEYMKIFEKLV
jgi:glycosyltransferase involved in cell wall biosynthesis